LPKGRADPPLSHEASSSRPPPPSDGSAPTASDGRDKITANVDAQPPVPVPTGGGRADSPLVVVDDSDGEDRPASKRRKLEEGISTVAFDTVMSAAG
jgi:hypothetical protein